MPLFATNTGLPSYLLREQERIEALAHEYGLDFFPVVFEMLSYDQMNEVAAYAGFPNRYPHWRFGMEYEQLSKSYEYGLSKIYEMVINNTPAFAYLLEGNSLTDQKLVMCHVYAHVDFFKNNFAFRVTDLDSYGAISNPLEKKGTDYAPDRKWVDKMANHGATVRRLVDRHGINKVEDFIDTCLSLENLIDPWQRFVVRRRTSEDHEDPEEVEVPRLRAKDYMEDFINPQEYLEAQRRKLEAAREAERKRSLAEPERDVLSFLLEQAPLERWERTILTIIREEAYYYLPQMQTKIMNEGWASYFHSKLMTERVCDWSEIVDYADDNAGVMGGGGGRLNPYKLGVELYRSIEDRWNKGQFGRDWESCNDLDVKRTWDLRLGLGREKIFEVRALYTDVTFIDEFLTPEFAEQHGLFTYGWSGRNERYEIVTREFSAVKEKLLSQLTNSGNPVVVAVDANYDNRGELLLVHEHHGVDLRPDYAQDTLGALARVWKRPVLVATEREGRAVVLRHDGTQATVRDGSP
jgi:stage V sporulation protein R